jgi:C1A family cysteine protease
MGLAQWTEDVLQMCPSNAVRDGHSVLLAGYRDDAAQPGGGVFIFRNTSHDGADGFMPYAYARLYMNDAVWVDFQSPAAPDAPAGGSAAR